MKQIVIDNNLLDEIVRRLVKAVDPDRIILFGSWARGDARPDSDVDLLIIKDSDQPAHRRTMPAYLALRGSGSQKTSSGEHQTKWKSGRPLRTTSPRAQFARARFFMKSNIDHARALIEKRNMI